MMASAGRTLSFYCYLLSFRVFFFTGHHVHAFSGGFGAPKKLKHKKQKKKKTSSHYKPDESIEIQNLMKLLQGDLEVEGAEWTAIGYDPKTNRRGVFVKDRLEKGEPICCIPYASTLMITNDENMLDDGTIMTDAERGLVFLQKYLMTTISTTTDGESSVWDDYLKCLPTRECNFDATPDFWSLEEIHDLEMTPIVDKALQRKKDVQMVAKEANVDVQDLQFATWLVKSRAFSILRVVKGNNDNDDDGNGPGDQIETSTVLIPLLDMINHSSDQSNAELQFIETKPIEESMFAVCATRPIPSGKEVKLSYGSGQEPSIELLMNYGFVPTLNPHDAAMYNNTNNNNTTTQSNSTDNMMQVVDWKTTLEEDEQEYPIATGTKKTILDFRIRMKQAQKEVSADD